MKNTTNTATCWTLLILFWFPTLAFTQEPSSKLPVPDKAVQEQSLALVKEIYKPDYDKARSPQQKSDLAAKLLDKGIETKGDPTGRFVLLKVARDMATQSNDIHTALLAIEEMAKSYDIDHLKTQFAAIAKIANAPVGKKQRKIIAESTLAVVDDAIAEDRYEIALELAMIAQGAARKASVPELIKQAIEKNERVVQISKSHVEARQAAATLKMNATDPIANLAVGKFRCFYKGDWATGVPMLAICNDLTLRELAKMELAQLSTTKEIIKLADGWWGVAEGQEGLVKTQAQRRAAHWYQQALPELSGLAKDKIEKRLREVPGTAQSTQTNTVFLDDLQETTFEVVFGELGKRGATGYPADHEQRVVFKGKQPSHSLSTHPPNNGSSFASYKLRGKFRRLTATAAIADAPGYDRKDSPVVFKVIGDRKLLWSSRPIQKNGDGQLFDISIKGVDILKLEVYCAGKDAVAHAVWIMPQLSE